MSLKPLSFGWEARSPLAISSAICWWQEGAAWNHDLTYGMDCGKSLELSPRQGAVRVVIVAVAVADAAPSYRAQQLAVTRPPSCRVVEAACPCCGASPKRNQQARFARTACLMSYRTPRRSPRGTFPPGLSSTTSSALCCLLFTRGIPKRLALRAPDSPWRCSVTFHSSATVRKRARRGAMSCHFTSARTLPLECSHNILFLSMPTPWRSPRQWACPAVCVRSPTRNCILVTQEMHSA